MAQHAILLTTYGSYGDIHPYMALALGLKSRGHRAVIGTSEYYCSKIESAGIEFIPIRPDFPKEVDREALYARMMDPKTGTEAVVREAIIAHLDDSYTDTYQSAIDLNCDIIISHGLTYCAPIVAEKLGIPWVFTGLQPIVMYSAVDPSVPPYPEWAINLRIFGPKFYRHVMNYGVAPFLTWSEPIFELREKLGLTRNIGNPIVGAFSPYLNLALFSREFASPAVDWPDHTVQTGFPFYDSVDKTQQPLSPTIQKFLDDGEPPIIFTLGTAAVHDARDFFKTSLSAARSLGERSILMTGVETNNESALDLASDTLAVSYAPYSAIFPRAKAIVHQGGIGTTSQALRAGKPMLIMPYGHDQPDNAARCERLGVAKIVSRRNYCTPKVARSISHLIADYRTCMRASKIGRAIGVEDGVNAACDCIVAILS